MAATDPGRSWPGSGPRPPPGPWPTPSERWRPSATRRDRGPFLELVRSATPKLVKNRLHLDLAPHPGDDPATEVARLLDLGATPADIGQGEVTWTVLADPEGNEFCVLSPR